MADKMADTQEIFSPQDWHIIRTGLLLRADRCKRGMREGFETGRRYWKDQLGITKHIYVKALGLASNRELAVNKWGNEWNVGGWDGLDAK